MEWVDIVLAALFFAVAICYSAVGHAGASGYIACMALLSVPALSIRPTALLLNLLVAGIGFFRFQRARMIPWQLVLPLIMASMPMAYLGAQFPLSNRAYHYLLAGLLALAAIELLRTAKTGHGDDQRIVRTRWHPLAAALIGGMIGFVAGLTGTGGAIFLTPLLIFLRWIPTTKASGASVVFVLANSIAGLSALFPKGAGQLDDAMGLWLAAVALGALVGTHYGRGLLPVLWLRRTLAVVLVIAACKLAFTH